MKYASLPPNKQIEKYVWNHQAILGSGSYGTVFLGRDLTQENKFVAIKVIANEKIKDQYLLESLRKEIQIMQSVKGPNLVDFYDIYQTLNNIYLITEFCNQGDLRKYLTKKGSLSEPEALTIFVQLLKGYDSLMKSNIIHRDLKPENILINDGVFKLADFGFSRWVNNFKDSIMHSGVGTPLYESIQILTSEGYTSKSDVWSLGIILFEMLYGKTPWPARTQFELVSKIQNVPLQFPIETQVSKEVKTLLTLLLEKDEGSRFSLDQVIYYPLIQDLLTTDKKDKLKESQLIAKKIEVDSNLKEKISNLQSILRNFPIDIQGLFRKFNKNSDGKLTETEFEEMISVVHKDLSKSDIAKVFSLFDRNLDSYITEPEFNELILQTDYSQETDNQILVELRAEGVIKELKAKIRDNNVDAEKVFRKFDISNDSSLNITEFANLLRKIDNELTEKELSYIFLKFDKDRNGEITYDEFRKELVDKKATELNISSSSSAGFIKYLKHSIDHFGLNIGMIFKHFDNGDGMLDLDEFQRIVAAVDTNISQIDIEAGFKYMDQEGKGQIKFELLQQYFK